MACQSSCKTCVVQSLGAGRVPDCAKRVPQHQSLSPWIAAIWTSARIAAVAMGVMIIVSSVWSTTDLMRYEDQASVVALVAEQRLLAKELVVHAVAAADGPGEAESLDRLLATIGGVTANHLHLTNSETGLVDRGAYADILHKLQSGGYEALHTRLMAFVADAQSVAFHLGRGKPVPPELVRSLVSQDAVLQADLAGLVEAFEGAALSNIRRAEMIQLATMLAKLGVLGFIFLQVLRPLVRRMEERNRQLEEARALAVQTATYDSLTGLYNFPAFKERLAGVLDKAKAADQSVAVLYLDLDRFKSINDTLGHVIGDRVLKIAAERLTVAVAHRGFLGRVGGDEFVICLEEGCDTARLEAVLDDILQALRQRIELGNVVIQTSASVGACRYPEDSRDAENIIANADLALYEAKKSGKDRMFVYANILSIRAQERVKTERELREAIERQEIITFYQPQYCLKTGKLVGLETLMRWQHRDHGILSPGKFLDVAETSGLIEPMGEQALDQALACAGRWHAEGRDFGVIAVNLGGRQLAHKDFVQTFATKVAKAGLRPEQIAIEIVETVVFSGNERQLVDQIKRLSSIGFHIDLDDFGTGHASLTHVGALPVTRMKIDQSFVAGIGNDKTKERIIQMCLQLADTIGAEAIAEGIETELQAEFLRAQGCAIGQGYLFARPMSAAALARDVLPQPQALALAAPKLIAISA